MKDINGDLWASFELFAKTYPDHPGARMTLELARWVREHEEVLRANPAQDSPPGTQQPLAEDEIGTVPPPR